VDSVDGQSVTLLKYKPQHQFINVHWLGD